MGVEQVRLALPAVRGPRDRRPDGTSERRSSDTVPATGGRLILRLMARNPGRLAAFLVLISSWQVSEALVPVVIGATIDRAVTTGDPVALATWLAVLAVLFAVLSYSYRFGAVIGFGFMQVEMHRLRLQVAGRALDPRGVRSRTLPGETLSLATSDIELIGVTLRALGLAVASGVAVLVAAGVLVRIDLTLGMVVLLGVPAILLLLRVLTPVVARRSSAQQALLARTTGVATDLVRGFRTLKGIGAEDVASRRYREASVRAQRAGIRTADSYGAVSGLSTTASSLFLAVVAALAGLLALEGQITVGELVAIVGLTQFLAEPMRYLGELMAEVAAARASAQRVVDYLAAPPLVQSGDRRVDPEGAVAVTLDGAVTEALQGLTVSSRPGELLGLAVTDPGEATDLVGLLNGEVAPERPDAVRLDDVALVDLDLSSRRRRLVVAPHHVDLFEGTVSDNVDPGAALPTPEIDAVLAAAACGDVLSLHPLGRDRPVSPDGASFSGGQRQRVAFARALATGAPALVLHDPTTAVDAVTEHRMAAGLRRVRHEQRADLVTWVLTSSPALLAQADRVVLVHEGRVVAEGTHAELCQREDYREAVLR